MAAKDQRIRKLLNKKPQRRLKCLPLLFIFAVVLACAAAVMLRVASKIHDNVIDVETASRGRDRGVGRKSAGGADRLLKHFASPRKKDDGKVGQKKSDNQQQQSEATSSSVERLIDRSHRIVMPDQNRTLAFVHIGKSGGSTISLLLRNGCMTAVDGVPCEEDRWKKVPGQKTETIASKRIEFYLHTPHVESGRMAEYYGRVSTVVVVARDPLERFVSAFLCRHPSNIDATRSRNRRVRMQYEARGGEPPIWAKQVWGNGDVEQDQVHRSAFIGCYPNVEELMECITQSEKMYNKVYETRIKWVKRGTHERDISLDCAEICQGIVKNENKYVHHVSFNYEKFLKDLPAQAEVLVIRTKNLWQDWADVNYLLGSKEYIDIPEKGSDGDVVNARGNLPIRNNLSNHGRSILCQILKEDIRIYIDLLNRAVNLSDDDVRLALAAVEKNCPDVLKALVKDKVD